MSYLQMPIKHAEESGLLSSNVRSNDYSQISNVNFINVQKAEGQQDLSSSQIHVKTNIAEDSKVGLINTQSNDLLAQINKGRNNKQNYNSNSIMTNLKKVSKDLKEISKEGSKSSQKGSAVHSSHKPSSPQIAIQEQPSPNSSNASSNSSEEEKDKVDSMKGSSIGNRNINLIKCPSGSNNISDSQMKDIDSIRGNLQGKKGFPSDENISDNHISNSQSKLQDFRRLQKIEKICDSDTEDEGSDNEKEVKWIILPENTYKRIWDVIIAIIIIYSAIVLPYKIAFSDVESSSDEALDIMFNIILSIDIVLNFFSAYVDNEDNIVKSRRKIIKSYLKSWFIIDLSSVLPLNYFLESNQKLTNTIARLSRIPKIYRLIRLTKLVRMVKILKKGNVNKITKFFLDIIKVNTNIERLIYFILAFLLLNHLAACVWYFMAKVQDLSPDCWVTRLGYIDASDAEIYIVSFYWTLTTVTTVGYGDINAGTTVERIYNLFIMSFGVLMYSFAIGSLSSIVSTLDNKTAEMNQKLQILSSIKKEFNLDQEIYEKVRKVIKYDLSRNQKDKMTFLQELPNKLRIELSQIMHDSVIQKMYFFKDQPNDFIAYVAPLLKPVKFSQSDFLYKYNDMIDEMYFVSKGTISFCLSKDYGEKEIKEIKKHNNFGEIEMCLNEKLGHNIKVKSRNCELFVLKKNDFLRLSVNFKEFIEKFLQKSLLIYLRFNDEKNKIIRQIDEQLKKNETGKGGVNLGKNKTLERIDEKEEDGSFNDELIDEISESGESENNNEEEHSEENGTDNNEDNNVLKKEPSRDDIKSNSPPRNSQNNSKITLGSSKIDESPKHKQQESIPSNHNERSSLFTNANPLIPPFKNLGSTNNLLSSTGKVAPSSHKGNDIRSNRFSVGVEHHPTLGLFAGPGNNTMKNEEACKK